MSEVVLDKLFGRGRVTVVLGDLTTQRVDAIVNAANSNLAHGGGVAGAIVRHGGRVIQDESDAKAPVLVGDAVVTGAGKLPCRWVIHAVGPVWGEGDEEDKLRSAVRNALARGEELGVASIAIPAISTGIFGYPKPAGCQIIANEINKYLNNIDGSIIHIKLVSIDIETTRLFSQAVAAW